MRAILSGPVHFADKRNIKKVFSTLYRECNISQTVLLMKRKDYPQNPVEHMKNKRRTDGGRVNPAVSGFGLFRGWKARPSMQHISYYVESVFLWHRLEPGGVAVKHRGLWSPRREFESLPGYHGFMEPNFIIPEDYDSSFNKPQANPITLEELKQQAGKMILN